MVYDLVNETIPLLNNERFLSYVAGFAVATYFLVGLGINMTKISRARRTAERMDRDREIRESRLER